MEFRIEKGQLQYINNRRFAHSPRRMLRFWNREEGTIQLDGQ